MQQPVSPIRPAWFMLACSTAGGVLISAVCVHQLWRECTEHAELRARVRGLQIASSPMLFTIRQQMQRVITETYTAAAVLQDEDTGVGPLDALLPLIDRQSADHQHFVTELEQLLAQTSAKAASAFSVHTTGSLAGALWIWTVLGYVFSFLAYGGCMTPTTHHLSRQRRVRLWRLSVLMRAGELTPTRMYQFSRCIWREECQPPHA